MFMQMHTLTNILTQNATLRPSGVDATAAQSGGQGAHAAAAAAQDDAPPADQGASEEQRPVRAAPAPLDCCAARSG